MSPVLSRIFSLIVLKFFSRICYKHLFYRLLYVVFLNMKISHFHTSRNHLRRHKIVALIIRVVFVIGSSAHNTSPYCRSRYFWFFSVAHTFSTSFKNDRSLGKILYRIKKKVKERSLFTRAFLAYPLLI